MFQDLGHRIKAAYISENCNEARLPAIASDALGEMPCVPDVDVATFAEFLIQTDVPQHPGVAFGDLIVTVYECAEFKIEVLFWAHATTTIHQHAFSGAFKVLVGSSFHSIWRFDQREAVSSKMLIGDCKMTSAEVLKAGAIRRIEAGRDGLIHALYHLDQPSITLLVRTHQEPWAKPQYSLDPPHVAIDSPSLEKDVRVRMLSQTLALARQLMSPSPAELLASWCETLDFPRLYSLARNHHSDLTSKSDWKTFFERAQAAYGPLAHHLDLTRSRQTHVGRVSAARQTVTDPDLRFFLAMLLNVPSQNACFALIETHYREETAHEFCVRCLIALSESEAVVTFLNDISNVAKLQGAFVGVQIARALEGLAPKEAEQAIMGFLGGALDREEGVGNGPTENAKVDLAAKRLSEIKELSPLSVTGHRGVAD